MTNFTGFKFILKLYQVTAVVLCVGGIVMMAYAEGFEGPNAAGVMLSVAAAIGAALYKVTSEIPVGFQTQTNMPPVRKSTAYPLNSIRSMSNLVPCRQGRSRGGGHTVSNIIVMAFSPRNIVGCLLKKKAYRGGSRAPQDPPRYALGMISFLNT